MLFRLPTSLLSAAQRCAARAWPAAGAADAALQQHCWPTPTPPPQPIRTHSTAPAAIAAATDRLRNFAMIAHVDHGKTTLMDTLLSHGRADAGEAGVPERAMDSGQFERERGITITSKYTSFPYAGHVLNAVDTPGHADFGGEVERCARLVCCRWRRTLCAVCMLSRLHTLQFVQ